MPINKKEVLGAVWEKILAKVFSEIQRTSYNI